MYNFKSALVCLLLGLIMYWYVENYGYSGVLFDFFMQILVVKVFGDGGCSCCACTFKGETNEPSSNYISRWDGRC